MFSNEVSYDALPLESENEDSTVYDKAVFHLIGFYEIAFDPNV